ncbi:MAG: DedA family protein [Planctomycetota bacterium]|nr:MAG: DedA family protein [Planctomycetota bacterium]REJ90307.1 MAG: DedA family protein [Planctomycetota bacterium]REK17818.1 MAG: DedA family protein [Planctomycetota bacterium]REK40952.1 MAG: DedA family protein [Planctomycetota bacterium]
MESIEALALSAPLYGYFGILLVLVLTGAGLPIPEEIPIVAAGVLSAHGTLDPVWAFGVCLLGALLGDAVVYSIGRYLGHDFFKRHPHLAKFVHEDREQQMEQLIKKHGLRIFFAARFMVGVRAPIYLAAGVLRVPWRRFLAVDFVSATIVVSTVFWLSYRFGETIGSFFRSSQYVVTGAVVLAAIIAGIWYFRRCPPAPPADQENGDDTTDADAADALLTDEAPSETHSARIVA